MDLVYVEEGFRGVISPDLKTNIVLVVSSLPEPPVGYDIGVETRDIGHVI